MNLPKILSIAKDASKLSDHHSHSIGCAVFDRKGRVLAIGCNKLHHTHPFLRRYNKHKTMHAETNAIFSIRHKHDLKGTSILVYRETKDGELAMAKPCEMCISIIKLFGIKRIFYTSEHGLKKILL